MLRIRDAYRETRQILGIQPGDSSAARWSRYVVECQEGDTRLLYQELTGELLALAPGEEEPREELYRRWFLVPPDLDEFALAGHLKVRYRDFAPRRDYINTYTIFTTMECNARCFYCYEKAWRQGTMTRETALKTVDYICRYRGVRKVYLTWFGGEPLCHAEIIDLVSAELRRRGVPYQSDMISNGYLFDENSLGRAADLWNLKKVRITLDGMHDTYRRIKNYCNDDPDPLTTVIRNIEGLLAREIWVEIRLHVDLYNRAEIHSLSDYLIGRFGGRPLVNVYPHLLYEDHDGVGVHHEESLHTELVNTCMELEQKLFRHGLFTWRLRESPRFHACLADEDQVLAVLPDGSLLKCRDYLDRPRAGNVWEQVPPDPDHVRDWKILADDLAACRSCLFYPECERLRNCTEKQTCHLADIMRKRYGLEQAMRLAFCEAEKKGGARL